MVTACKHWCSAVQGFNTSFHLQPYMKKEYLSKIIELSKLEQWVISVNLFDSLTKTFLGQKLFWDKNKDGNETMEISISTVYELQL